MSENVIGNVYENGNDYVYFESYCSDCDQNGDEYSCIAIERGTLKETCFFNSPPPNGNMKYLCKISELPAYKNKGDK